MPATPMTPELKREIDALRLSNQLDPKKFLRGGAKRDKVGEFFQVRLSSTWERQGAAEEGV